MCVNLSFYSDQLYQQAGLGLGYSYMRLVTGRLPVLTFDLERGNIPLARPYRGWVLAPGRLPLHFCMNVLIFNNYFDLPCRGAGD